ncbi:MAG TPA: O-antigen translocase [Verrucomicrobiae bacterium]|jgi:PST family polysaccharide transporter|nr:O-antigen translocase [Verrucomicrobiae bacterium]
MSSHRQIFKSTALIGGMQVINLGIGIVRTKVLALLLGPSGVGLAGLYTAAVSLVGSVAGFGINASGVRQVAAAAGTGNETRIARTIVTLRRASLCAGMLGMVGVLALASLLSRTTFGDHKHVFGIGLMSLTLLFGGISAGQNALLQGLRRLRDMAASEISAAIFGAVVSIGLVWWLREQGIVPYLVTISAFGILLSWWYARRVPLQRVTVTWGETLEESRGLLALGSAFMASALIASGTAYFTRVFVQRRLGTEAVGIYTAVWTLSTYYVGIVLVAMAADFLPRLTAAANDPVTMNRLVNEQTETGMLIAVPGVLATLTLAPWVMKVFYSAAFVPGAEVVRWQILGVFLRVVSWPLAFVLVAKGRGLLFTLTELAGGAMNVGLVYLCVKLWKLNGAGIAFALLYVCYTGMMLMVVCRLTDFRWSSAVLKVLGLAILVMGTIFVCARFLPGRWSFCIGLAATLVVSAISLLTLQKLLGMSFWRVLCDKLRTEST